jgi:hypothetical protein
MNLDDLIKYIIWIVFFGLALAGIYYLLKNLGIM